MGNEARECRWRHAPEACGGFWKSQLVEFCLRRRRLAFTCSLKPGQWPCGGCRTRSGADRKASIERLCISLPYVETFNSKVIKGFIPELRSCYVFFVFRDSYVLCIYVMNILCTFRMFMYGYVSTASLQRSKTPPPMSVLDVTLNSLMVRFRWYWSFGECGAPLHCHCSKVHSGPERLHLVGPCLWVK